MEAEEARSRYFPERAEIDLFGKSGHLAFDWQKEREDVRPLDEIRHSSQSTAPREIELLETVHFP